MIAIPNMEKPQSCWECFHSQKCKLIPRWLTDEQSHICATKRLGDCPLIEIVTCGECIHFHYDKPYIIQGIPVFGHEVCDFWGDGCKTNPNGFCSYGERRADE